MLLKPIPTQITTQEQLVVWAVSELRNRLYSQGTTVLSPHQITESQGYYPSDVVSIQEIRSVDAGPRHILRVLMPVAPGYYGASTPVWQFAGLIVGGGTAGSEGVRIPGQSDGVKVRWNNMAIEKSTDAGVTWSVWGTLTTNIVEAYIASDGKLYVKGTNGFAYVSTYGVYSLTDVSSTYPSIVAASTSMRLHP